MGAAHNAFGNIAPPAEEWKQAGCTRALQQAATDRIAYKADTNPAPLKPRAAMPICITEGPTHQGVPQSGRKPPEPTRGA